MRYYLFESAIWGNHAETIKDKTNWERCIILFLFTMGLKLGMCQFAAIKEAQRGLTIVKELRISPEMRRIA